jgi:dGTPase
VRVAEEIVERLFRSYAGGDPMPGRWGEAFDRSSGTARLRVVSDFVAGMTDPFALSEYTRLFDLRPDFG